METLRIKIEIGDRKFEADGPAEIVQIHFNAFMKLTVGGNAETLAEKTIALDKIMKTSGTVVWLNIKTTKAPGALLVLLLGQKQLRNNILVSGTDLIHGLRASGHRLLRADYILNSLARGRYITVHGKHRGRRYQLTDSGLLRAQEIAQQLLGSVPTPPFPNQTGG